MTTYPNPLSIHVHAAGLDYGGAPLFRDLTFDVRAAEWTALLGPSGGGKTTLLKLIAGLVEPWAGSHVKAADGSSLKGRVAYMAQQDLLFPWLTVLDNVTVGNRLRGERPDTDRARDLLAAVGLAEKSNVLPGTLSGGQKQRAALARTLMEDRPVVLMDEPFSALDAITRHQVQALAAELLGGRTVLLVTHDPMEALRLGNRLHVLSGNPATLGPAIDPPGPPPRDPAAPGLAGLHKQLMQELALAHRLGAAA